jgi:hypothetical protein
MIYDVYIGKIPDAWHRWSYWHIQCHSDDGHNTCHGMPEEYSHNDKPLYVAKKPITDIRIVGQAQYYRDNNKHNIKILR